MTSLFRSPAAGFDPPLRMLTACHERVQDRCATLIKLAEHLPAHGSDEQARQAAANVLRYFDSAAVHHHEDEEQDLFPLLQTSPDYGAHPQLPDIVARLLREHRDMAQRWQALREKLVKVSEGAAATIALDEAADFAQRYAAHIDCEEKQLFPLVSTLLSAEQISALGRSMARRRGVR